MKIKKLLACVMAMSLGACMFTGCGEKKNTASTTKQTQETTTEQDTKQDTTQDTKQDTNQEETKVENPLEKTIPIEIEMEDGSVIKAVLYPDIAPATVENFVKLCKEDFYAGLIFHRVIKGFMIQGGGYDKDFNEKEAESISGEFKSNGFTNRLKHTRGVLSMARTNDPNSASSQFFIMHAAAPHLDGEYAAFGIVTEGIDVVDKIASLDTTTNEYGMSDVPVESQIIKTIRVVE